MKYADSPQVLNRNRVERLYLGGSRLDRWQRLDEQGDGHYSEEFIVSTVPYIGPGNPPNRGISSAVWHGKEVTLDTMIREEERKFLGKCYEGITGGNLGVLARVGDSTQRLIIQCHPTDEFAREYLGTAFGKTEAWYIVDTRDSAGYCYAGLKKDVKRRNFEQAFLKGDSERILKMMHKVRFHRGDMILIPAGMPHAMGPNVTFLEFHQPCDYTLRYEKVYFGKAVSEEELHCGLGLEKLMGCVDFSTYTYKEIVTKVKKVPKNRRPMRGGTVEELLSYEENPCFRIVRATIISALEFQQSEDSHCIMVATKGDTAIYKGNQVWMLPQGRGAVIPSCVDRIVMAGEWTEVLVAYPFALGKEVNYGLFI